MAKPVLSSYLNTLLFALISLGICVGIMLVLLSNEMRSLFTVLIVVDIGLLIVILMALARIVNGTNVQDNKLGDGNAMDKLNPVVVTKCPDYYGYEYRTEAKTLYCNNTIVLTNPVTQEDITYTLNSVKKGVCDFAAMPRSIELVKTLQGTSSIVSDDSICTAICKRPGVTNDNSLPPWTYLRPFCNNCGDEGW